MPLPWLQDVDPAERLPDDTKWEDLDDFTLWKQCKLRGLEAEVKKDGDALQLLNALNRCEVEWLSTPRIKDSGLHFLAGEEACKKALESVLVHTKRQIFQVIQVEERNLPDSFTSVMVIELSDAVVRLGKERRCNCNHKFEVGSLSETCTHILYLELHVVKCPRRLLHEGYLNEFEFREYFANAPPGFKPQKFVRAQDINSMISGTECQLCFMEAKASRGVDQCQVCGRVAHQKCKNIYRARRAACEGDTGCPLCCPNCPWNPSSPEVKAELVPTEVKKEPGVPRDQPATAHDAVSSAAKHKVRKLKQKVRKLRCQLRRKPGSRVMSSLRYERLAGKIGKKGANYRRNKLIMAVKKALKSENAQTKDEDKAAVFKKETESPVKIIKVEKTKKVKSKPVVISLL